MCFSSQLLVEIIFSHLFPSQTGEKVQEKCEKYMKKGSTSILVLLLNAVWHQKLVNSLENMIFQILCMKKTYFITRIIQIQDSFYMYIY